MKRVLLFVALLPAMAGPLSAADREEEPAAKLPHEATAAGADALLPSPVESLLAEAQRWQEERPEQWKRWDEQLGAARREYDDTFRGWRYHPPPPAFDIGHLNLPLGYLLWWHRKAMEALEPRQQLTYVAGRCIYLRAIAYSADNRRVALLLDVLQTKQGGGWLLVAAIEASQTESLREHRHWRSDQPAPPGRHDMPELIEPVVRVLLEADPALSRFAGDMPLPRMLYAFSDRLPDTLRQRGYDWLQQKHERGPEAHGDYYYWDIRFRLDASRARRQVLPYYDQRLSLMGLQVLRLLLEHAEPCEQVADAMRQSIKAVPRDHFLNYFRWRVLLLSAPERELAAYIANLEAEIRRRHTSGQGIDHASYYLDALRDHLPRQSIAHLRRYANDQRLNSMMQRHARCRIVLWFVEQRDEQAEQMVARWLAEENSSYRAILIEILSRKGEFERELLRRVQPGIELPAMPPAKP